ncbi:universal stress protein [Parvularcula sp. ZS-1/3]|uniref:Universal stress protein n=1 Tax=Parvularcula mediterranea TaxID=2732508 RepID=A0A7Y3RNW3_9PROT|nr:universal stress protein [Parvularcula mediterranea]NNU17539.1 universal stress protein [Parvularcula mediterranea]
MNKQTPDSRRSGTILTAVRPEGDLTALERAGQIAKAFSLPLRIETIMDEETTKAVLAAAEDALRKAAGEILPDGVEASFGVRRLAPQFSDEGFGTAAMLLDTARVQDIAMVVLNKPTGKKSFGKTMVEKLLRLTRLPVLTVDGDSRFPYEGVLAGVDFGNCAAAVVDSALLWAPGANWSFVHAYDPVLRRVQADIARAEGLQLAEEEMSNLIERQAMLSVAQEGYVDRFSAHIEDGTPRDVIARHLEDETPDLLVLGGHGRSGFASAILGSCVSTFIERAACDVMIVRG